MDTELTTRGLPLDRVAINTLAMRSSAHGMGRYIGAMVEELLRQDPQRYLIYTARSHAARWRAAGAVNVKEVPSARGIRLLWEQTLLPADLRRQGAAVLWGPAHALPLLKVTAQVLTIHDLTWFTHPQLHTRSKAIYFRTMLPIASRRADRIIADSEATAADIERILHVDSARVRVIPLAADGAFRPATRADVDAVRQRYGLPERFVLSVGVLEPRKNHPGLIAAMERWRHNGRALPLVLAGSLAYGWHRQALMRAVERSSAEIRLLGHVPEADLPGLISASTVMAYVPFSEGFGLPVLEAMACGTPVVASRAGAVPEVGGDAALYVDPTDPQGIAAALEEAAVDAPTRDRLRAAGLARASQFTWRRSAEALRGVFDELAPLPQPAR